MTFEITPGYQRWRDRIFTVQPEQVNIVQSGSKAIYGVIMDIGMIDASTSTQWAISISAFSGGEASFLPTPGGAVIGFGGDPRVAEVAQEIVEIAQSLLPQTKPTDDLSLPEPEIVQFFFLTPGSIRMLRGSLTAFQAIQHPYYRLLERFQFIHYLAHQPFDRQPPQHNRRGFSKRSQNDKASPTEHSSKNADPTQDQNKDPNLEAPYPSTPEVSESVLPTRQHSQQDSTLGAPLFSTEDSQISLEFNSSPTQLKSLESRYPALKWFHILVLVSACLSYIFLIVGAFQLPTLLGYLSFTQSFDALLQQGDYATTTGLLYRLQKTGFLLLLPISLALPNIWQIITLTSIRENHPAAQKFSKISGFYLVANVAIIASLTWFFVWVLFFGLPEEDTLISALENTKYYWLFATMLSILVATKSDKIAALRNITSLRSIIDKINFVCSRDPTLRPSLKCSVKAYRYGPNPFPPSREERYSGVRQEVLLLAADKTEIFDFQYWRNLVAVSPENPPLHQVKSPYLAKINTRHRLKATDNETIQYIQKTWIDFTNEYIQYSPHVTFSKQIDCEHPRQDSTVIALQNVEEASRLLNPSLYFLLSITPFSFAYSLWLDYKTIPYSVDIITEYSHDSPIDRHVRHSVGSS